MVGLLVAMICGGDSDGGQLVVVKIVLWLMIVTVTGGSVVVVDWLRCGGDCSSG